MRFRRRAKIFPGVYLNFSSSGISTTIGPKGFNVNFSKNGTYLNTGIPGTGLYDRQRLDYPENKSNRVRPEFQEQSSDERGSFPQQIHTKDIESTTSEGLQDLKNNLISCYNERLELEKEIKQTKSALFFATIMSYVSCLIVIGFFVKWFRANRNEKKEDLGELQKQLEDCYIDIDMNLEPSFEDKFLKLHQLFNQLSSCEKIWNITSEESVDRKALRATASLHVTRKSVAFSYKDIDIIRTKYIPMHLENANRSNIFIYPTFLVIIDNRRIFGLIDIRELNVSFNKLRFVEREPLASDAAIVDKTWDKVNKNGSPDQRFKENFQIPICEYGEIYLKSSKGLNEAYAMSSYNKSESFAKAFIDFQGLIKNKK